VNAASPISACRDACRRRRLKIKSVSPGGTPDRPDDSRRLSPGFGGTSGVFPALAAARKAEGLPIIILLEQNSVARGGWNRQVRPTCQAVSLAEFNRLDFLPAGAASNPNWQPVARNDYRNAARHAYRPRTATGPFRSHGEARAPAYIGDYPVYRARHANYFPDDDRCAGPPEGGAAGREEQNEGVCRNIYRRAQVDAEPFAPSFADIRKAAGVRRPGPWPAVRRPAR